MDECAQIFTIAELVGYKNLSWSTNWFINPEGKTIFYNHCETSLFRFRKGEDLHRRGINRSPRERNKIKLTRF